MASPRIIHDLTLDCYLLTENNPKKTMRWPWLSSYYIISKHFRGGSGSGSSSSFDKYVSELDANGSFNLKLREVNIESDYIRFQVFNHAPNFLFLRHHVATINVQVSELLLSCPANFNIISHQEGSAVYEVVKSAKKHKKVDLKIVYRMVKMAAGKDVAEFIPRSSGWEEVVDDELESKRVAAAAIGNDIGGLLKTLPTYRHPLVSLNWS